MKLANAFSMNMIREFPCTFTVTEVTAAEVPADAESVVGHADTAAVFASVLGRPVAMNRATVTVCAGEVLYVGQYSGPRLPEGATALPPGASIKWLKVVIG